ncbi:MAG: hypothetical protein HOV83_35795 [Catenulispora sp.]|nr:hypothetical protein [Catenulispora sp.]
MSTVTEIDTTIGRTTNNGPSVTRIWHCGDYTIRARVAHDSHRRQSYALAEVLTPARTWTEICETPPEDFHVESSSRARKPQPTEVELLTLADQLMRRACQILRVPATGDTAPAAALTGSAAT